LVVLISNYYFHGVSKLSDYLRALFNKAWHSHPWKSTLDCIWDPHHTH